MSSGTGKRPAATRGQARYSRRDSAREVPRSEPQRELPLEPQRETAGDMPAPRGSVGRASGPGAVTPRKATPAPRTPALRTPSLFGRVTKVVDEAQASPSGRRGVRGEAATEKIPPAVRQHNSRLLPPEVVFPPASPPPTPGSRAAPPRGRAPVAEAPARAVPIGRGDASSDSARIIAGAAARSVPAAPGDSSASRPLGRPRRGFAPWRRANRRITVESRSPALWIGEQLGALARRLLIVGKVLAAVAVLVAAVAACRLAAKHVVASPRFAVRDVRVGPTNHVSREEIVQLSTVQLGDRLLALDTDVIAARLARHPWIAATRVRRELPATLVIDITERQAAAVAVIGGLYLLDEQGHPFKHATLSEADGQVVLTGISRREYAGLPRASEAAFREALSLLATYQHPDSLATARHGGRPALSEIHIDPRTGFSLFLYDSGAEVRLGRGNLSDKLARFDEIIAEFGPRGISAVRVVHLDGPAGDRVPIRLVQPSVAAAADDTTPPAAPRAFRRSSKKIDDM